MTNISYDQCVLLVEIWTQSLIWVSRFQCNCTVCKVGLDPKAEGEMELMLWVSAVWASTLPDPGGLKAWSLYLIPSVTQLYQGNKVLSSIWAISWWCICNTVWFDKSQNLFLFRFFDSHNHVTPLGMPSAVQLQVFCSVWKVDLNTRQCILRERYGVFY